MALKAGDRVRMRGHGGTVTGVVAHANSDLNDTYEVHWDDGAVTHYCHGRNLETLPAEKTRRVRRPTLPQPTPMPAADEVEVRTEGPMVEWRDDALTIRDGATNAVVRVTLADADVLISRVAKLVAKRRAEDLATKGRK